MLERHKKGSYTIRQDEENSMVYGMPRVDHEMGGCTKQSSVFELGTDMIRGLHFLQKQQTK